MKYLKEYINFGDDWEEIYGEEEDNSDYDKIKEINKDFYNFLVKENIIDQYIYNIKNDNDNKLDYGYNFDILNFMVKIIDLEKLILLAFEWKLTEEGFHFWDDIHDKWKYLLNKV